MALKGRDNFLASQAIAQQYPSEVDVNGYFVSHPETELDQVVGLARQNSTAYAVGNIAFSSSIFPLVLVCTTAGTTAATEPSFSGATVGGTVTDGAAVWTYMPLGTLSREITPAFNHRDVITTSGTYTAPVSGWYKITVKGGGGGGQGGESTNTTGLGGGGGGEGGTTIGYEKMTAGDTASIVIGAGGTGGAVGGSAGDGGNSTVTVNSNTYTGGGGNGGNLYGGAGGIGTITGCTGGQRTISSSSSYSTFGGIGGGENGGTGGYGAAGSTMSSAGGTGGNGYVWFEYFLVS